MSEVSFIVYGRAQPAGSKTIASNGKGRSWVRDSSKNSYPWKRDVAQVAGLQMRNASLLEGPLRLSVLFVLPRPRSHLGTGRNAEIVKPSAPPRPTTKPDTTKLLRAIEDACTGIVWRDDAQIVEQYAVKRYGEPARVLVEVEQIIEQAPRGASETAAEEGP